MSLKLEITTIVHCTNMCSYCPQKSLIKSYKDPKKKMSFEDFKTLMLNVPKNIHIEFAGFSEAFLNEESSLMMKHCIDKGYKTDLYTTLIGFNNNDINVLKNSTFNMVSFHECDSKKFNREEFDKKMKLFKDNIGIKEVRMARITNPYSRVGQVFDVQEKLGPFYCGSTKEFDHNVLLPNGEVSICCMDYSLKHIIGNLFETDYMSLKRQGLKNLANQYKSDIICRKCEVMVEKYPFPKF